MIKTMNFLKLTTDQRTTIFEDNLLPTNRGFNYYVDWSNVGGLGNLMVEIHAIDVLISCEEDEFFDKFKDLLSKVPTIITLFPMLFGLAKVDRNSLLRGKNSLLIIQEEIDSPDNLEYKFHRSVKSLSDEEIKTYYGFFVNMGLKNLYQKIIEKSTLDYITGILVGLDSNGRKNRGGKAFELACEPIFKSVCQEHGLTLLAQKKFRELRRFGFEISDDIKDRKADFIIVDEKNLKAMNFEVNFYNGPGSKPEEIIDSYINRQNELASLNIEFSLVTDGKGCWTNATNQLNKGFRHLNYLQNFYMLKHGMLEEIVEKVFGT